MGLRWCRFISCKVIVVCMLIIFIAVSSCGKPNNVKKIKKVNPEKKKVVLQLSDQQENETKAKRDKGKVVPVPAKAGSAMKGSMKKMKTTNPIVLMKTSKGDIKLELDMEKAPITVKNFMAYVEDKFYDGTIFHRVIDGFMIQGGGFTEDFKEKTTMDPIKNEAGNGLKNLRGTIAMARTNVVDSATSQFFINVKDNSFLDHVDNSPRGFGYAVFGKVIDGMDVVDRIKKVKTDKRGFYENVPVTPVVIKSIRVISK